MADVFISYKAEDRRRVQPLVQALQGDGFSVWWDEHIGAGDAWRETIERQLDEAKCVIVAWSKRSIGPEGAFVREEASRAQRRGVYIPVLIDAVEPPLGFGESQATSLRGWRGSLSDPHYDAVRSAVRRNVGEGTPAASPPQRVQVDRRTVIVGGTAAAVAVAGAGTWALLKPGSANAASDSIAVLPFANLSGDPGQAYFSDGVAEEIRSALARVAGLKVVGRTSSEAVRNDDARTAAKKLGVTNILAGSVRQSSSTIRIDAELIDGTTGMDRWSQDYDRAPGDSIKIQTDIAEKVAVALSAALGRAARAAIALGGTENAAAQKLMLQANALSYVGTVQADQRALDLLDTAIALDPNYAQAYGLKSLVVLEHANQFSKSGAELAAGRTEASRYAAIAIRIAPQLPIAHGALAEIYRSELRMKPALSEYKRVFQLAPAAPDALRAFATFLVHVGDPATAMDLAKRALALDRLNPASYGARATVLYCTRRYADVVRFADELKRNSPQLFVHPVTLANCLVMLGRFEEARRSYAQGPVDEPFRLVGEAVLAARMRDRAGAHSRLDHMQQLYGNAVSYQASQIHAQLGEVDEAFASLDRAWEIKDPGMISLKVDPWLDPLRGDARFTPLLRNMDFPFA